MERICSVCSSQHYAKGYCLAHYRRWQRHGDPLGGTYLHTPDDIWQNIEVGDCWEWTASLTHDGYAYVNWACFTEEYAHRIIWTMLVGPIPAGLELDHVCRNRRCVNPDHCEPVTPRQNMQRGYSPSVVAQRSGLCKNGHPQTPENTYANPSKKQPNARTCGVCQRERKARARARKSQS